MSGDGVTPEQLAALSEIVGRRVSYYDDATAVTLLALIALHRRLQAVEAIVEPSAISAALLRLDREAGR